MKRIIRFLFLILIINSCTTSKQREIDQTLLLSAKGGRMYGGVFKLNEADYIKNLFPHNITDAISYRVASQIYEGLLKFNQNDLSLTNGLTQSYQVSDDKTLYTFKIKEKIFFHDDPCFKNGKGREVTSDDIRFCFTLLCTQNMLNQGFSMFQNILVGANEYYNATANNHKPDFHIEGIKIIDKYTISFRLTHPNSIFLYNLARPFTFIFPQEAFTKYGFDMREKAVGTGPFQISTIEDDKVIILSKNSKYHASDEFGNRLPYLDGIKISFIKEKKTELLEFKKGNLDMMYRLPTDFIIEILNEMSKKKGDYSRYELQRTPEMATHFLSFLNQGKIFNNKNLRIAFSYAIDRQQILEAVLNGEGYAPATHGITPLDIFKNPHYDVSKIRGYEFNLDSARHYLLKAGFADVTKLPPISLELNSDGERNIAVAEEIKKQLKQHLNIEIELNTVPFAQLVESMIGGKSDFFRGGWIADYPNPENFLWFFYGKNVPASLESPSYPNMMRYQNSEFDRLYEAGINAKTPEISFEYFMKAENLMMTDAPIILLWYDEGYRLVQSHVKNFMNNAMQYRDFSLVYFDALN